MKCVEQRFGENWAAYQADCVDVVTAMERNTIDLSIYSPPFSNLYVYSDSDRDMGNSGNDEEFFQHYGFLVDQLYRVTRPGRLTAVHCSDLPLTKWKDGVIGIKDFSGDIIKTHERAGWVLHSRVTIWKCPVVEMTRTKALGLLYKQLQKDSSRSRQGLPDYLLVFRKVDETNPEMIPIPQSIDEFPLDQWQKWASPVWMDVNQTRVLDYRSARAERDERHLCPLQLDVIERAVVLWSNKSETIFSPFMGIGSEGHVAITMNRKFVGCELKGSYFDMAIKNLAAAENRTRSLFEQVG